MSTGPPGRTDRTPMVAAVTEREEAVPLPAASVDPDAQGRARARARLTATLREGGAQVVRSARLASRRLRRRATRRRAALVATRRPRRPARVRRPSELWSTPPTSVADLLAYTRSGAWVPGERAPVLEAAGKAYGYLVAVPVSVLLYAVAWLLQRPGRLLLGAVVVVIVRLSV